MSIDESFRLANIANQNIGKMLKSATPLRTEIVGSMMPINQQIPDFNTYLGSKEQRKNAQIQQNIQNYGIHVDPQGIASKNLWNNNYSYTNTQTGNTQEYNNFGQNTQTGQLIGDTGYKPFQNTREQILARNPAQIQEETIDEGYLPNQRGYYADSSEKLQGATNLVSNQLSVGLSGIDTSNRPDMKPSNSAQRKVARKARRDANGDGTVSAGEFMNSGAGQAVSAVAGLVGGAVNALGNSVGQYADRPTAQQLDETQEAVRSGIYSAVSAIPGVGQLLSASLQFTDGLGKMFGTQMSSISKDASEDAGLNRGLNNAIASIPVFGSLLGGFAKKADEFEFDRSRVDNIASAYDMSTFDSADDLSGGKFLGQTNQVNEFIAEQNRKKNLMTGISDVQRMRREGASSAAADLAQQNRNRYGGITGQQFAIGKEGMKMPKLNWARNLLAKFKDGGKTEKPKYTGRSLEELKAYADSVNPRFIQRANDTNIPYITWTENGKTLNGTHLLNADYGPEGEKGPVYVYPEIQEIDGKLVKFPDIRTALDVALRNGNVVPFDNLEEAIYFTEHYKEIYPAFQKFQKGGKLGQPGIESNVIVEGAYHAHKNHLDEINPELSEMTPKGIPVATEDPDGVKTQVAEIEVGELILTKELTEKLEALYKDGSDEAAIQAGMLFAEEIIDNTVDNKGGVIDADNI